MRFSDASSSLSSAFRRPGPVAAAALALVLVAAPFLPDASGPEPALTPASDPPSSRTAGPGAITPAMQTEIDRVVAEAAAVRAGQGRAALARSLARCATFEGQRYCLGVGWTTRTEDEVAYALAAAGSTPGRERTGDLDSRALMRRTARMSPARRAAADRAELTAAARSVAKVWLLRHEIQGVPLPDDFAARHPEAIAARGTLEQATTARPKRAADYPEKYKILKGKHVRAQNEYYWCGPTAMQAIGWGWKDKRQNQSYWARRLRTTTAGTAITDMVRVINNQTGYDNPEHAGRYVALDISDWSFREWYLLMMRHIHDYKAPVVLHPVLLKQYFPYLDDDASGHFQVGRGFDQNRDGRRRIGYFEPWDQSKFDPTEPFIDRVQWRNAYRSYRANLAHFQTNVGV